MITYFIVNKENQHSFCRVKNHKVILPEIFELLEDDVIFDVLIAIRNEKDICAIFLRGDDSIDYLEELRKTFGNKEDITESKNIVGLAKYDYKIHISHGTDFQRQVWEEIMKIPYGETRTYGELAALINKPKAYRAVATACGSNYLSIIIPCHRVVNKNANISGYRWGKDVKDAILAYEKQHKIAAFP